MDPVHETRARSRQGSAVGAVRARPQMQPADDWLGEISDEDWSENAAERAERRRSTPAYQDLPAPEDDYWPETTAELPAPARPASAPDARRAAVERRRLIAGFALVVVVALAVGIPVLLLRGGNDTPAAATETTATTSTTSTTGTETPPSTTPATTTPSTSTSSPSSSTTPSTSSASGFTLPEGTKLRLGEGDPAQIEELQRALTSAGYDPGPVDGDFGQRTEAAVTAFQQANGLSADGVVGPETASALNSALSG
jgi:murein L,D-transpeptidase YcbB/YkuD